MAPRSFKKAFEQAKKTSEYWAESALLEFLSTVDHAMQDKSVSRAELAKRMGTSAAYISKLMNGSGNLTHRTMAAIAHALDLRVHISLSPIVRSEYGRQTAVSGYTHQRPLKPLVYRYVQQAATAAANQPDWQSLQLVA